jgi:hypothetical protein
MLREEAQWLSDKLYLFDRWGEGLSVVEYW